MKCDRCERLFSYCECYLFPLATTRDPAKFKWPSVIVKHGGGQPGQGFIDSMSFVSETVFKRGHKSGKKFIRKEDLAVQYTDFLNSDAIFDCVVPKRFLNQERAKT